VHLNLIRFPSPGPQIRIEVLFFLVRDRSDDFLYREEMGLIGIADGASPVIRKVLNFRPRPNTQEGVAMEGVIFENIADITPVFYHEIAAVNGVIFSLKMIKWFEIIGFYRISWEGRIRVADPHESLQIPRSIPISNF